MKRLLLVTSGFLMACIGFSLTVQAAVYYVDGSLPSNCTGNYSTVNRTCTGTEGNAYNTVQAGVNAAISADDVVYVRTGTYNGKVSSVASGGSAHPITISRYGNEVVTISSAGSTTSTLVIAHNNITIDGIRFTGTGKQQYYPMLQVGLKATHSVGITVKNCYFSGGLYETYGMAVYSDGGIYEYNEFVGSPNMFVCIHVQGVNNIIRNNTIHNIEDNERIFDICSGSGVMIKNNTVYNMTVGAHGAHVDFVQYVGSGMGSSCTSHLNGIIEGNLMYASPQAQITTMEPGDSTGAACAGWMVRDNVFANTAALWWGCKNSFIINNTFYSNAGTDQPAIFYSGTGLNKADNLTIKNNLFIGTGGDNNTLGWYAIYNSANPVSGLVADYNYVTKLSTSFAPKSGFSEAHGVNGGNPLLLISALMIFLCKVHLLQ